MTSCVVDSSGKVAASVIYAGGQFVFATVMHFELQISSRIFLEKIELYCEGIIGTRGMMIAPCMTLHLISYKVLLVIQYIRMSFLYLTLNSILSKFREQCGFKAIAVLNIKLILNFNRTN